MRSSRRHLTTSAQCLAALAWLGLPLITRSATITKGNNTTDLNLGGSWVGGVAAGVSDIGLWDATVTGANTTSTGASTLDWNGIRITNPGGDVTINGPGYLRIGSGGVDMSSATSNLSIANFDTNANNTWNIATGRSLTISQYYRDGGQVSLAGGGTITYGGSLAGNSTGAMRLGGDNSGFTGSFTQTASTSTYFENPNAGSANAQWAFNGTFLALTAAGGGTYRFGSLSGSAQVWAGTSPTTLEVGALGLDTSYSGLIQSPVSSQAIALSKVGSGRLTLTSANTYSGGTNVGAGTLAIQSGSFNALNTTAAITVGSGATLTASQTANNAHNIGPLTLNGGTLTSVNGPGGTANDGGFGNWLLKGVTVGGTGLATISPTTLAIVSGTFNVGDSVAGSGNDLLVSGRIISGALTKQGAGTMTLTSENTHGGGTTINGGTLVLADPNNNGIGTVRGTVTVNSGGTLVIQTANATGYTAGSRLATLNINGGLVDNQASGDNGYGMVVNFGGGAGTFRTNGGVTSASTPQLFSLGDGAAFTTSASAIGTAVIAGRINLREGNPGNALTFSVNNGMAPVDLSVTAAITEQGGARGIVKAGAGTMALTGPTSHTGGTTVTGGTLQLLTGYNQLNFNGPVTVDAGAVLTANAAVNNAHNVGLVALNGGTLTSVNGVGGAANDGGFGNWLVRGVVVGGSTQSTISSTTLAVVSGSFNVGDSVAGAGTDLLVSSKVVSGAVSKTGAGTLVLSDPANTHSGATTVAGGTLLINNGSEQTLGVNPGTFTAGQLALDGGTLQVSGSSLTINDANRGVQVRSNSGTFLIDSGLTLTMANALDGNFAGGTLTKNGSGTFNLTNSATLNALRVAGGTYIQATGTTTIPSISTGLDIQAGGIYALNGGSLRTDRITIDAAGALNWGSARLTHANTIGDDGVVDHSAAGYHAVRSGTTMDITGTLATGNGSVLALHASPTLYLNAGLRFNNVSVTGDLNLGGVNDVLELELNPYLLRPFSPNFGSAAQETGSLPLLTWTGTLSGSFDSITGVLDDGLGFTFNPGLITDPTTLAANSYAFEYDLTDKTLWFHYRVSGYVPEPGSFGLLGLGVFLLRAVRGAGSNRHAARLGQR